MGFLVSFLGGAWLVWFLYGFWIRIRHLLVVVRCVVLFFSLLVWVGCGRAILLLSRLTAVMFGFCCLGLYLTGNNMVEIAE